MPEPPHIPIDLLRACLRERYDLVATALEFLPRGYDYLSGVYLVVSEHGTLYLLKVSSRPLYEPSCLVPRHLLDLGITAVVALRTAWAAHRSTIHTAMTSLELLAAVLQSRTLPYVICHGDLHPANLLRTPAGQVFMLDWDEVMLAPKERDFIFIREPQAHAFGEGYGSRAIEEIDWTALTYFRWERVIQDLIYETQQVLLRDEVSEDTRATAAQRFAATFAVANNVDAAYAAAAHLPRDLGAPPREDGE